MLVYVVMETFVGRSTQPPSLSYRCRLLHDIFFILFTETKVRHQASNLEVQRGESSPSKLPGRVMKA